MHSWETIVETAGRVPAGVWVLLAAAAVLITWRAARRRMRHAGRRTANPRLVAAGTSRAKDTALTVAAMIPAVLFWGMVLAGSFRGLVAFARETLRWRDGWEYLVPGSLDGVSVTFALLAFRAIRKQKAPDRSYRVVWDAAIASALVNFNYEYTASGHNLVAGGYLALLSLFGMVMFHEFLHQFEEGTGYIRRETPRFGLRWITWPANTFCAAVAWYNHPPARGTAPTVRNAVANLQRVRQAKRAAGEATAHERHAQALVQAQRHAELAAARHRRLSRDVRDPEPMRASGNHGDNAPDVAPTNSQPPGTRPADATPAEPRSTRSPKVPSTAWRLRKWIDLWVQMCADHDLALGPINDDQHARTTYGASARHLDNIRKAAVSGAMRNRARELGVPLPKQYVDDPARRLNGRARVPA